MLTLFFDYVNIFFNFIDIFSNVHLRMYGYYIYNDYACQYLFLFFSYTTMFFTKEVSRSDDD